MRIVMLHVIRVKSGVLREFRFLLTVDSLVERAQYEEVAAVVTCFLCPCSQHGRLHQGEMNDKKRELIVTD